MIFVSVGVGGSEEIVKKVDEIAQKLNEEVFIVLGNTKYVPKNCKWVISVPTIIPYVKKSHLVITHGGAGTIFECLNNGARIITIAKRHADDHQTDIIAELESRGYIINCPDINDLEKYIKSNVKLEKYNPPKSEIAAKILKFLAKN